MPAPRTGPAIPSRRAPGSILLLLGLLALVAPPARAALDLDDRGPILRAGDFNLRVSNAGILGNPFPERSFDPSFEYPKGSGQQLLHHAALWVGAIDPTGQPRVSGGPLLEWRPTTAVADTVLEAWHGRLGSLQGVDDDGDARLDEERLNGRDDDGDGETDEDLGLLGQQMLSAEFRDDRPEAVSYLYPGYERHTPLGLSVEQDVFAWSWPGYRGIVGLQYAITYHGIEPLRDAYFGIWVDFDLRPYPDNTGTLTDEIVPHSLDVVIPKTPWAVEAGTTVWRGPCSKRYRHLLPLITDPRVPALVTVVPFEHSLDTLHFTRGLAAEFGSSLHRKPKLVAQDFRISVFSADRPAENGGLPRVDAERYAALAGQWPESPWDFRGDQAVLVSFGPFPTIEPGQTIRFATALIAASRRDSLDLALSRAVAVYDGRELNLMADRAGPRGALWFTYGESGTNGHESWIEAPPGVTYTADPDCPFTLPGPDGCPPGVPCEPPSGEPRTFRHGEKIWVDADCDKCTGKDGNETVKRWMDPHLVPPTPSFRLSPRDHAVRIEWDNLPEILVQAGRAGSGRGQFAGYNVYRLADWRGRGSLMPPDDNWALVASFGRDESGGRRLLSAITDTTLDYTRRWYGQPHYPIGRYAAIDSTVLNGFDYYYVVTTVIEERTEYPGFTHVAQFESPIVAQFAERVSPQSAARSGADQVWVVPNPYRARSEWQRPAVPGDPLSRHLDFMGLPRARCTIKVWTVAGDLVATIDHDGSGGDGQASWDLLSRNGQEVSSGIYLFTVDSPLGQSTGRFVVVR